MRTIPVPNRNPVGNVGPSGVASQALVSNLRMDEGAMNAPNRALAQAGGAIAGAGEMLGRFEIEKAELRNKGILAKEETIRGETAASIQAFMERNPADPDSWAAASNSTWAEYEKGRTERAKKEKWAPDVVEKDKLQYSLYRSEFGIRARATQDKALIGQANARLEANADQKLRAGDTAGAAAEVKRMNLTPEAMGRTLRRVFEEGSYKIANNQLDALRDLPPAQAIPALEAYKANLLKKNDAGKYEAYEFEEGGMSLGGRVNLESITNARLREAEAAMYRTGRRITNQVELGAPLEATIEEAVKRGEMNAEIAAAMSPEWAKASAVWQAKEAEKAATKAKMAELEADRLTTRQANAEDRMRAGLGEKVSLRDIEKAEAIGIARPTDPDGITKEAGARLRTELQSKASAEREGVPAFTSIDSKLNERMGQFLMFGDKAQENPTDQMKLVKQIQDAKLSKETRLGLMRKFFDVRAYDLKDAEVSEASGDRDIGPEEQAARMALIQHFQKQAVLAPSPQAVGDLYFKQSAAIEKWMRANSKATPETKKAAMQRFTEAFAKEIDDLAGIEALSDIFNR
jgi:polyhydroxyalkanoate synthesis regulator phasin